ncbi:MAG: SprT-like domain-containing protein [Enhygromyxa sp.]
MSRSGAANRKARAARRGVAQTAAAELEVEYEQDEDLGEDFDAHFDAHFDRDDEFDAFDAPDWDEDEEEHEAPFVADDAYPDLPASEQEALRNELQDRLGAYLSQGRARVVITDNLRTMMSIRRSHGVYTFRLHHMFVDASPAVLRAAAAYAEQQDRAAAELLREFIDQNDDAIRQRRSPRACTIDVEGRHYNLQEIFDELNREYFGGAIRARITWGPRARRKPGRASIKLGSYTVEDELIRVHPVLDAEDVPRHYLAWVVYHEMLHEIHDMPVVDGRRVYHTRAFRLAEAKFEHYAEAVLWERTHLHKLLDR